MPETQPTQSEPRWMEPLAAILLALSALAQGGEVIVSRGELVEIGGGFRIPDVIRQGGARLVEVGSTNKTRLADYHAAITPETTTMNAPVGPPICTRLPPSREIRNPPTIAVIRPFAGLAPDAMAMAKLNGMATIATVMPATERRWRM